MQSRRTFFGASALAVSALSTARLVSGAAPAAAAAGPYDFAAIEARLALPFAHRQAFGSDKLADGIALNFMVNSLNAYQFDYPGGPGTLHAAGIFYGTSVALLVDGAAWRKYKIGVVQERRGDAAKLRADDGGNPYAKAASTLDASAARGDLHGFYHDRSVTALVKRGASFFACDNALRGLATDIAVSYGMSDDPIETVHADLRARLLPGTLLVPAGVATVNQAQEMKFTFLPASV